MTHATAFRSAVLLSASGVALASVPLPAQEVTVGLRDPAGWVSIDGIDGVALQVSEMVIWCALAWFTLAVGVAYLATVPGYLGRVCLGLRCLLLPKTLHRLVSACIGMSVAMTPSLAAAATPDSPTSAQLHAAQSIRSLPPPVTPTHLARELGAVPSIPHGRSAPGKSEPAYRVRPGDSLWSIVRLRHPAASETHVAGLAAAWYETNRTAIGGDPDHLEVGQVLQPPRAGSAENGR